MHAFCKPSIANANESAVPLIVVVRQHSQFVGKV